MENGAIIDMAPEFRAIHGTAPYRNIQLRMLPVYKKAVADMHAKNKVLIFDVENIPLHVYAKMHTANEYHWRPKQGKVAGRRYSIARTAPLAKYRCTPTLRKSLV